MASLKALVAALLCMALVALSPPAHAQDSKAGAVAPSKAELAAKGPGAADTASKEPRKKKTAAEKDCEAAGKKVAKEQGHLDGVQKSIASKKRAMPDCTTKTLCARFEADLKALDKLRIRHEKRLATFTVKRDQVCAKVGTG